MVLTVNSDFFPKQNELVELCSANVMCFLWGTNWIFIYYLREIQSLKVKKNYTADVQKRADYEALEIIK
jgi:hypothetical protein